MFIYCIDDKLKAELANKGFKLINEDKNGSTFILDKNIRFDFNAVDKNKLLFTNRLNF